MFRCNFTALRQLQPLKIIIKIIFRRIISKKNEKREISICSRKRQNLTEFSFNNMFESFISNLGKTEKNSAEKLPTGVV